MEMLYAYLTGSEFRMHVEATVEGFTQMQKDLDSEKRAIESFWSKRQKLMAKVLLGTTSTHGAVKGIAGSSVQEVTGLEFEGEGAKESVAKQRHEPAVGGKWEFDLKSELGKNVCVDERDYLVVGPCIPLFSGPECVLLRRRHICVFRHCELCLVRDSELCPLRGIVRSDYFLNL